MVVTCPFHNDAEEVQFFIEKCFPILRDVGRIEGGKNSDLVESILTFFLFEGCNLDLHNISYYFFECVYLVVRNAPHFIHRTEATLSYLLQRNKVCDRGAIVVLAGLLLHPLLLILLFLNCSIHNLFCFLSIRLFTHLLSHFLITLPIRWAYEKNLLTQKPD